MKETLNCYSDLSRHLAAIIMYGFNQIYILSQIHHEMSLFAFLAVSFISYPTLKYERLFRFFYMSLMANISFKYTYMIKKPWPITITGNSRISSITNKIDELSAQVTWIDNPKCVALCAFLSSTQVPCQDGLCFN